MRRSWGQGKDDRLGELCCALTTTPEPTGSYPGALGTAPRSGTGWRSGFPARQNVVLVVVVQPEKERKMNVKSEGSFW
ncbi:hypothetical protein O3P69_010855 [Scylla paramamosain]|uniref:Uncharacterized protein n=1 Tax=Scylla paramamosain TaxID=85552 RepID=A0AAW0TIP7_SCYPA